MKTIIVDKDEFDGSYDHYRYSEEVGAEHTLRRHGVNALAAECVTSIRRFKNTVHITYEEVY